MSRVTHIQVSFNGGELSRRLSARIDQNIYDIALAECTGFAPLMEGPLEAMPGTIRVAAAKGPCRVIPFEFNSTQGHVLEFSDLAARVFTNDAQIMDGAVPFEITTPYSYTALATLTYSHSEDVTYLFHSTYQTQQFTRVAADDFQLIPLVTDNGPWEPRNKDKAIIVSASDATGAITLSCTDPIFEAGDVGGLFMIEAPDFGDVAAWEPGITVLTNQNLTWNQRVYRVVAAGRTGSLQPEHGEGIEWDGIGTGTDINSKPAGGVQLEYVCDRFGTMRITGFTDANTVSATVVRTIPVASSWRWSFGAFSNRRGWPVCGVVWNERLVLCKGRKGYASVAFDLTNYFRYDENGEISADMAFDFFLPDGNEILHVVADDRLMILTAGGLWALGPNNAAAGVGPGNWRVDQQSSDGASRAQPALLDSRTLYVGRSRRRIFEADYSEQRGVETASDMTRFARHMGTARFTALAVQHQPHNMVFAARADGSMASAAYVPNEQVLGWANRRMAEGMAVRDICSISDPEGELHQIWMAAEYGGSWHILRMATWRDDGEARDTAVMLDMAEEYQGAPASNFTIAHLPNRAVQVVADGRVFLNVETGTGGAFTLPEPAAHVVAGLPFPAFAKQLWTEKGGDNGPSMGKTARISQAGVRVIDSRGLRLTAAAGNFPIDLEQQRGDSALDAGFDPDTGMFWFNDMGDFTRAPWLKLERVAPVEATVLALGQVIEVQDG